MKVLVSLATLDQDSLIQTREENALATLANLSVQEEVGLWSPVFRRSVLLLMHNQAGPTPCNIYRVVFHPSFYYIAELLTVPSRCTM
jgi:hypothetical protein